MKYIIVSPFISSYSFSFISSSSFSSPHQCRQVAAPPSHLQIILLLLLLVFIILLRLSPPPPSLTLATTLTSIVHLHINGDHQCHKVTIEPLTHHHRATTITTIMSYIDGKSLVNMTNHKNTQK